jgi:RNA polymerase sigma-70 factor, ECF subfamily
MASVTMSFSGILPDEPAALAAGLRRRDPELLDLLIVRYEYRLYRYLLCLNGDRATAEDLFQETWMRVLERGEQYNGKSNFDAWLFSIARNLTIDLQRRKKSSPLDDVPEAAVAAPGASAFDEVFRRERETEVQNALERLAPAFREVLLLRFQEDLPLAEVASIVGAPLPTVKSRLYRALDMLRETLGGAHA